MRLRFEELGPRNFKGVRDRIALLDKHVKDVLGETWQVVQDAPDNRRKLQLVCQSGRAEGEEKNDWLTSCAIL